MKTASNRITPASIEAVRTRIRAKRLPKRTTRVYCLGCGKTLLVPIDWYWPAVEVMQKHARDHGGELSQEYRASVKKDPPTNDLVVTMSWGMTGEIVEKWAPKGGEQ